MDTLMNEIATEKNFIAGIKTKLIDVTGADAQDIINLRNDPRYNKFLFQKPLSIERQLKWIAANRDKKDNVNFKVTDINDQFKGTISVYDIKNKRGEFGRYIVTNPINAIESEYLLLKFVFENLKLDSLFCQTNVDNASVWNQHPKLGFRTLGRKDVLVGDYPQRTVQAVIQEISAGDFYSFDYSSILQLIEKF